MKFLARIKNQGVLAVTAVQARLLLVLHSLLARTASPLTPVARQNKALSFLEYAILAAAIIGVGVVISVFFRTQLTNLLTTITNNFNGL